MIIKTIKELTKKVKLIHWILIDQYVFKNDLFYLSNFNKYLYILKLKQKIETLKEQLGLKANEMDAVANE